ncbi:MAG: hypothetical protein JKX85_11635 [Phycisphaeraceae bacterium]|nr:hypothetical protein [Phycisphaeraceae bacterium]
MPIVILSPFSGRPVKIRDKDIGRSVRDEENRVFYAVPRSDGEGYYAAITRNGSEKDEQRYLALLKKDATADVQKREELAQPVHNAMGNKPKGRLGRRVIFLVILGVLAWAAWTGKDRFLSSDQPADPHQTQSPTTE